MKHFANPILAVVFGAFIVCAETCQHFESIVYPTSWLELPLHDWLAGICLIVSGVIARRDWRLGQSAQAAAWGFMVSLLIAASVAHAEDWAQPPGDDWIPPRVFLGFLAGLLGLAGCGLFGTLVKDAQRRTA